MAKLVEHSDGLGFDMVPEGFKVVGFNGSTCYTVGKYPASLKEIKNWQKHNVTPSRVAINSGEWVSTY